MKLEKFNTLKLIHDNIPEVTFVISSFVYEAEIQLYHNYIQYKSVTIFVCGQLVLHYVGQIAFWAVGLFVANIKGTPICIDVLFLLIP